jgi:uncharacterized protein YukE
MSELLKMDFAAQEAAMGQVKQSLDQLTDQLGQIKNLHASNLAAWERGGNEAYNQMGTSHQAALQSIGEFTQKMHSAMTNHLTDYQGAVSQTNSGITSTPLATRMT